MKATYGKRDLGRAGMLLAVLTLTGCGAFGNPIQTIREGIPPPDEFQVIASKPVVVPSDLNSLPEPNPGQPSPLAPDPHLEAKVALLGSEANAPGTSSVPSAGEADLLASADAANANTEIRTDLLTDKDRKDPSKPYEPPLIWEALGLTGDDNKITEADRKQMLDAQSESIRLLEQGTATAVDPNPPVDDQASTVEAPSQYPTSPKSRPNRNPLAVLPPPVPPAGAAQPATN